MQHNRTPSPNQQSPADFYATRERFVLKGARARAKRLPARDAGQMAAELRNAALSVARAATGQPDKHVRGCLLRLSDSYARRAAIYAARADERRSYLAVVK